MKKMILLTLICLLTLSSVVMAVEAPPVADFAFNPITLNADILVDTKGRVHAGVGYPFAAYKEMFEARIEIIKPVAGTDGSSSKIIIAAGIGVDVPKLIKKSGGEWLYKNFNPKVFILAAPDVSNNFKPSFYAGITALSW